MLEGYGYCITITDRQTDRQALVDRESVRRIWILYNHNREADRQTGRESVSRIWILYNHNGEADRQTGISRQRKC